MDIVNKQQNSLADKPLGAKEANIGKLLLDLGKIKVEDAERILRLQKQEKLRFGDAAVKLGLITEADILQVLSMQFDYPYLQPGQNAFSQDLVAAYQPFSPQVEALRALRSQLIVRWFSDNNKALTIMAAKTDDGASNLAANLAIVFSQLGEQTLLIDANLRNPVQHSLFNLAETRGLSDILVGRADIDVITKIQSFVDLSVLGAGTIPPNPQELLNRPTFKSVVRQLSDHYDVIIIDSAPAVYSSDAYAVASLTAGVVLASKLNQTKVADLKNMQAQLTQLGTRVIGAVITQ